MTDIHDILKKYWGYSHFRPLQQDIIESVLDGKDTLALLPTGGGKSLCFQVPALAKEGLCLVVSPLIALMKDQVENLLKREIPAVALYSGMSYRHIDMELDKCIKGTYKFLYVSPERLKTEIFKARLPQMQVNLIAIDEAHCISQWGYDFRPEYLQIAEIRKWVQAPVLALTATATATVVDDIQEKLQFKTPHVFRKSFERKNLHYWVLEEENKLGRILSLCKRFEGTGVVYARNRKLCRDIAEYLYQNGISADYYHAGLDPVIRNKKQDSWIDGRTRVMVSTNAFGMGIDKSDVRFVIHYEMPDSLEAYYQEAGRAGRDEKNAWCIALAQPSDRDQAFAKMHQAYPEYDQVNRIYEALCNHYQIAVHSGNMREVEFNLVDFAYQMGLSSSEVFNALRILELQDMIQLAESIRQPARLHIMVNHTVLYDFEIRNPKLAPLIQLLLRNYGGLFDQYVYIDENFLARNLKAQPEAIVAVLEKLKEHEIWDYVPAKDHPTLTFLKAREHKLHYDQQLVKARKREAEIRLEAVYDYALNKTDCRSRKLLAYFDEAEAPRCGQCDVCQSDRKHPYDAAKYRDSVEKLIKQDIRSLNAMITHLGFWHEEGIQHTLQLLLDEGKIYLDNKQEIHWKE
ncbi:MAG: RecQ family ATP-dependent DNA helicase [Bacteroidota bacterium]|nr:RecQ family ATP-dependent DNA helicase [Bacteroidota bacterium]MDX5431285.1 RecQ family ATP-dependent DNA helicase [Bacteroidota bacterium]MDX5470023.1 RecQ family ATP-dependent DNA helicase [Bacteroidota bacterium]